MMSKTNSVFLAGHRGLVGSAIHRNLVSKGYSSVITKTHDELDLLDQRAVFDFLKTEKPEVVIIAAAKVGGIGANMQFPAEFIAENLMIEANIIHGAFLAGIKEMLFLGSSCIYPRDAEQPIKELSLMTGPLEPTNAPYAVAKIAGVMLCDSYNREYGTRYRSVMPTNLYGPGDNFDIHTSHVLPSFIRRFHDAKVSGADSLSIWGTGKPRREFLYVDDMADACVHLMENVESLDLMNIGCGQDFTIVELAKIVADVVGYKGQIVLDPSKPDGVPRKLLDVSRLHATGWSPVHSLEQGVRMTYQWFCENINTLRK